MLSGTPGSHGLEDLDQASLVQRAYVTPDPDVEIHKAAPCDCRRDLDSLAARITILEASIFMPHIEEDEHGEAAE